MPNPSAGRSAAERWERVVPSPPQIAQLTLGVEQLETIPV
jgi:hypothetical protein